MAKEEQQPGYYTGGQGEAGYVRSSGSAYTNPTSTFVDYGVIADQGRATAINISNAQTEKAKQRQALQDKYKADWLKYNEEKRLETNAFLNEETAKSMNESIKFVDWANMNETKRANTLASVKELKVKNDLIIKTMEEMGDADLDIKDTDKPAMQAIGALMSGDTSKVKLVPRKDGTVGADYEFTDENGKKTLVTQREMITQLGSLNDISETKKSYNTYLGGVAKELQTIVKDNANINRDKLDDIIKMEVDEAFMSTIDEDTKEIIFRNVISKGVDYDPKNPNHVQLYKDHLKERFEGELYKNALIQPKPVEQNPGGGKTDKLPFKRDLYDSVSELRNEINKYLEDFNTKDPLVDSEPSNPYESKSTKSLIGKQIEIDGNKKTIKKSRIVDGKLMLTTTLYNQLTKEDNYVEEEFTLNSESDVQYLYSLLRKGMGDVELPTSEETEVEIFD